MKKAPNKGFTKSAAERMLRKSKTVETFANRQYVEQYGATVDECGRQRVDNANTFAENDFPVGKESLQ